MPPIKKSIPGLNLTYSASKKRGNQRHIALSETIKLFFNQQGFSSYDCELINEQQLVSNEDLQPNEKYLVCAPQTGPVRCNEKFKLLLVPSGHLLNLSHTKN